MLNSPIFPDMGGIVHTAVNWSAIRV